MRRGPSKHSVERDTALEQTRTLPGLANPHWDVRKGDLNRPWPRDILVFFVTNHTAVDEWVDVVRVNLTSGSERDAAMN